MRAQLVNEFERGKEPIKAMGIGIHEKIMNGINNSFYLDPHNFYFIPRSTVEEIIDFLLKEGYSSGKIVELFYSEYMRKISTAGTAIAFSINTFLRFYNNDILGIKEFLEGKIEGVDEWREYTRQKQMERIHKTLNKK
jgi:hypothetical protein